MALTVGVDAVFDVGVNVCKAQRHNFHLYSALVSAPHNGNSCLNCCTSTINACSRRAPQEIMNRPLYVLSKVVLPSVECHGVDNSAAYV